MLSNQTCYWGVGSPPPMKNREKESGGESAACWGRLCYHVMVMFGQHGTQCEGRQSHITLLGFILKIDTLRLKVYLSISDIRENLN